MNLNLKPTLNAIVIYSKLVIEKHVLPNERGYPQAPYRLFPIQSFHISTHSYCSHFFYLNKHIEELNMHLILFYSVNNLLSQVKFYLNFTNILYLQLIGSNYNRNLRSFNNLLHRCPSRTAKFFDAS